MRARRRHRRRELPVFATGVSPNSPDVRGPGSVGLPIVCGGRAVASGDVIVADRDGVVVVPSGRIEATLLHLERVRAAEAAMGRRVREGLKDVPFAMDLLKGDRIRRVEP